jgi:hypothetical protein
MGVATGFSVQSTTFTVPLGTELGASQITVIANGIESAPAVTDVLPFIWPLPFNTIYAEWQRLIGSLADGPLWVLGPNGPVPVDPMARVDEAAVRSAWKQFGDAFENLRKLGDAAVSNRLAAANKVVAVVDPDLARLKTAGTEKLSVRKAEPSASA